MLDNDQSQRGGDPTVAIALIKEGLRRLDQIGTWYNDVAIRVHSAEALDLAGNRAGAEAALAAARPDRGARLGDRRRGVPPELPGGRPRERARRGAGARVGDQVEIVSGKASGAPRS